MKKNLAAVAIIVSLIVWSCSKVETNINLRQSVEKGIADISTAVTKISGTTGYKLLSVNEGVTKSDYTFYDTIDLSLVAGIYDFKPDTIERYGHFCPFRLFQKTGESENMVINIPEKMAFHPWHLHSFKPGDTIPSNNFKITATDYHIYFNWWHNFEYKLTAGFRLDNEDAGSMDVSCTSRWRRSNAFTSKYNFKDGYNIGAVWQDGDTATSAFFLAKENDTLFLERNIFIWKDYHRSERLYSLTIGDVEIRKSSGIDSIQVFLNGSLQQAAAKIITDDAEDTGSVCHKRDIQITFDDGTTAVLSDLMEPVRYQLGTLRESLRSMYFARNLVDFIAFSIYFEDHEYHY